MKTVIVGGVAGGASAAARLRRLDETAEIILLERGEFVSFANCGLPYYIGGAIKQQENLTVQTPEGFRQRFNIDVRIFNEAVKINRDAKEVVVRNVVSGEEYTETYDNLILSPGAEPIKPALGAQDSLRVFTLRNIPDTLKIKNFINNWHPKTAVVVGGGYIGVEMADNLKHAGLDVTIVEMADHLIAPLDFDMAADVYNYALQMGIHVLLKKGVQKITDTGSGLSVELTEGVLTCDMLIMSVGVRPESALAKEAGLEVNSRGAIVTDNHMRTNDPFIYALGDAVQITDFITGNPGFIPLAGPANKQGRIAADNICGIESIYTGTQGSAVLKFFDMTVATTGLNEKAAALAGIDYDKTYTYSANHATYYPGANQMSVKVLWEKATKKIIGAQIVGFDGVEKRMDVLATAIRFGAKVTDLTALELCYAPPFGSAKDPVNMVGFVAENVEKGLVQQFFWHDVKGLPRDGSVTLLDVRTKGEINSVSFLPYGVIDGFVNIPLDELRQNLDTIPKDKPVYIHCVSGLRSYIACRILSGLGYTCYNLAGGWRLYYSVMTASE